MLSIFPQLLIYGILIPTIFRLFLSALILKEAWDKRKTDKRLLIVHSVLGILLAVGLFVQPVGLIGFGYNLYKASKTGGENRVLNISLALLFLALALLGPGIWSIDLPL